MLQVASTVQHRGAANSPGSPQAVLPHLPPSTDSAPTNAKHNERWWHTALHGTALLRRYRRHRTRFLFLLCALALASIAFLTVATLIVLNAHALQNYRRSEVVRPPHLRFLEDEVQVKPTHAYVERDGGVCVVCAEGHVLFRSDEQPTSTPIANADAGPTLYDFPVCLESEEDRARRAKAAPQLPLRTVQDCIARLHNLGLLRPPRAIETAMHNASCVQLRVSVHVLGAAKKSLPLTHCSSVVAQLRRSATSAHLIELSTPRLTAWPVRRANASGGVAARGSGWDRPPYVGTAPVQETDVDGDVSPPSAITIDEALRAIVVQFSPFTNHHAAAVPPDLHCPLRFLTVRLGRFGRHHNQLQEVLNTLALAARLNRTLILPPFVSAPYAEFVRLDTEIFYGWHTLRQVGRCCLLTYAEARPLLRQVFTEKGQAMTMERVHISGITAESKRLHAVLKQEREQSAWGSLPVLPTAASTPLYDADAWFACGVRNTARSGRRLLHQDEPSLIFREGRPPWRGAGNDTDGATSSRTLWEAYQVSVNNLMQRYGGVTDEVHEGPDASLQPDLVVLSSVTAFHLRPRLEEMTRLLGLLRPSPSVTSEVGRFYRLWAPQYKWPVYTNIYRTFDDCLQPSRFKGVVGLHVRRRERTCRQEAENPSQTTLSLSEGRYVLEGTGSADPPSGVAPLPSTVTSLVNDCLWDVQSTVHLFHQYSKWLKDGAQQGGNNSQNAHARQRYTSFVAYDEQVGPIGHEMEVALQRLYMPAASELLPNGMRPSFTAVYDRRLEEDFDAAYRRTRDRVRAPTADPMNATAMQEAAALAEDLLLKLLYPVAEMDLLSMAFDFFMLSNTEVFRGNALSSVSINVCLRRWGRGLPCHGVMVGYYETLYKGFS